MQQSYTKWEKFKNWFDYNKWYVVAGAFVVYILGTMVWNILGIGQTRPDYTVSYVGSRWLPEDCVEALEAALAAYGQDLNGDGVVAVQVSQHVTGGTEDPSYSYAASVTLMADITQGESAFFLLEDPDAFQQEFLTLADLDGSAPDENDPAGLDKVYRWADCPVLAGLELGEYTDDYITDTVTGQCQQLLGSLYFGRRYFYQEAQQDYARASEQLWQQLTAGALPVTPEDPA